MRLRQLEYFVAVVEHGSIRRAAEHLFVAQPSLSTQLAALEREVGGALLNRHARGVTLTPAGRVFLREARATLASADRARRFAGMAIDGETGELIVATVLSIAAGLLPGALSAWRRESHRAHVVLQEYRSSQDLEDAAAAGLHDVAVGPQPRGRFDVVRRVGTEEFVVVLPEEDPMLAREAVDLADLADRPWVKFAPVHGLAVLLEERFAAAGIAPEAAVATSQTDVAVRLAVAGLGPALVPANVVGTELLGFTRPLDPPLLRDLYAYSANPLPSLAEGFLRHLTAVCATELTTAPGGADGPDEESAGA